MTNNSQEPLSIRILSSITWTIWVIIHFTIALTWWLLKKTNWIIKLIVIIFIILYFHQTAGSNKPPVEEKPVIIYQEPSPTEVRLASLEGTTWTREDIDWYIKEMATKYEVSESYMHHIIKGESNYNPNTKDGDMYITCARTGLPVRARGLVQITECYFPEIPDKEARDPAYAIEFLAKNMADGLGVMLWSTHPERG